MTSSKVARSAALLVGGTAMLAMMSVTASAQTRVRQQPPRVQQEGTARTYNLSRAETAAIAPLLEAMRAATAPGATVGWSAAQALIGPARAAARSDDARYLVDRNELTIAAGTNNATRAEQLVAALLANPSTPAEEQAILRRQASNTLNLQAERAFAANDFATAERIYRELLQANPGDARITRNLEIIATRMGNSASFTAQIAAGEQSGQFAADSVYVSAIRAANTARNDAQVRALVLQRARAYPVATNWRDAIELHRSLGTRTPTLNLDLWRLSRAAGALQGEGDYIRYAQLVDQAGLSAETKAVVDAGIAAGAFTATRQGIPAIITKADRGIAEDRAGLTAEIRNARAGAQANPARAAGDALYGYGRYGEAAELYRAALTKTGADTNLLNLRLGTALAMVGQRAEAETALRAATGDAGEVAKLWLAWLGRRAG